MKTIKNSWVLYRFHNLMALEETLPIVTKYASLDDFNKAASYMTRHRRAFAVMSDERVYSTGHFSDEEALFLFDKIGRGEFKELIPTFTRKPTDLHTH